MSVVEFGLCFLGILLVNGLCKKISLPSVFGMILLGVLLGKFGLGIVKEETVKLLGGIGLMYLMMMMTLEMDVYRFVRTKKRSIIFGLLTAGIPFFLGWGIGYFVFGFAGIGAMLVGCMMGTHTLVSYPIVGRFGISERESVIISIGGTIITDVLILLLLTVLTAAHSGEMDALFWLILVGKLLGFMVVMLIVFPWVGRLYFAKVQSDDSAQYIFILTVLFVSGILSELCGIEPIVGAFLSGLMLNRIVPKESVLMSRTFFIGETIFVPFFMLYIGSLVDISAAFQSWQVLSLAGILIVAALLSKFLAAKITQRLFGYTNSEGLLLFGLSSSRAAATLAIILIGYKIELFPVELLNIGVLLILLTCICSSFMTDFAARKVVQENTQKVKPSLRYSKHIILPLANEKTAESLFNFSMLLKSRGTSLYPLAIGIDSEQLKKSPLHKPQFSRRFAVISHRANVHYVPLFRIEKNVGEGIIKASEETQGTQIILGWSNQNLTADYLFGSLLEKILSESPQTILCTHIENPPARYRRICVVTVENASLEQGFALWMGLISDFQKNTSAELLFMSDRQLIEQMQEDLSSFDFAEKPAFQQIEAFPDLNELAQKISPQDIVFFVSARPNTISYKRKLAALHRAINRFMPQHNVVVIYPASTHLTPTSLGNAFSSL